MKKILLLTLFSVFAANAFAQTDSLAYQLQRKKINTMLANRRIKFGEYDQSLNRRSGIFGFRTKNDIKNSNAILMEIVQTDDDILQQTKILLDYQVFASKQALTHSAQTDSTNVGFMNTINKLRAQNEKLKQDADTAEQVRAKKAQTSMFIIIGLIVVILLLLRRMFVKRNKNL
jgi:hypothetical protein